MGGTSHGQIDEENVEVAIALYISIRLGFMYQVKQLCFSLHA